MRYVIEYSKEQERRQLASELPNISFYEANGYFSNVPKGIKPEGIAEYIETHYDEKPYAAMAAALRPGLAKLAPRLGKAMEGLFGRAPARVMVTLTRFGCGGIYYKEEDRVAINFGAFKQDQILGVIAHETVHMLLEPYVLKHKIEHWEKERIMGLIMHSPAFAFTGDEWDPDYHGAETYVDQAFEKHFEDGLDRLMTEVVKARPKH